MAEEGAAGVAEKAGSGIGKLVTWMLVAVFGFAGYAQPGWPFSFKDIAAKILGWLGIGGAGANISTGDIANLIAGGLYSDGTGYGGKEITGLGLQVPINPATGSPGGIDRSTWNFWRSKIFDFTTDGGAAVTAANVQTYFNKLWAQLVRGNDRPDLIVVDSVLWGLYMNSLQAIQRFSSSESATLGFVTTKFMDADVVLDGGIGGFCPANTGFFLNTKYLFYRPHAQRDMVALSPGKRYSVNQDAEVQILAWAGNLTASGLQFQGRCTD